MQADGRTSRGAGSHRRRRCHAVTAHVMASPRVWLVLAPTVSHGRGARIFATCGANAGEAVTTSRVGPSATISPSASTTIRWRPPPRVRRRGSRGHRRAFVPQALAAPARGAPCRVVEAAGRLVEQQHGRLGGERRARGRERAAVLRTDRAGECAPAMPGASRSSSARASARGVRRIRRRPCQPGTDLPAPAGQDRRRAPAPSHCCGRDRDPRRSTRPAIGVDQPDQLGKQG